MTRSIVFWAVTLAIALACAELASFALMRLRPDLFDQREAVLDRINRKDFEGVRTTTASNSLGWDNPAAVSIRARSCLGDREVESTYDSHRTRLHGDRRPGDAVILVAGNSYAHGNEVDDNETLPAQLEQLLGVPTANLGVSGYGPDQALLKLERMIELFPHAKFAILSISYDDATRMLNSFRPILQRPTGRHFGLKPFVTPDGLFREIIGGTPYRDFEAFIAAAAELSMTTTGAGRRSPSRTQRRSRRCSSFPHSMCPRSRISPGALAARGTRSSTVSWRSAGDCVRSTSDSCIGATRDGCAVSLPSCRSTLTIARVEWSQSMPRATHNARDCCSTMSG